MIMFWRVAGDRRGAADVGAMEWPVDMGSDRFESGDEIEHERGHGRRSYR